MKSPIRMIAFDLDDTLLNAEKQISPRAFQAIHNALAAGYVVLPASGRPLSGIPAELRAVPGLCYALTTNGARVYHLPDDSVVYADCFERPAALELLDFCADFDTLVSLYMAGRGYAPRDDYQALYEMSAPPLQRYLAASRLAVDDLRACIVQSDQPVEKFSLFFQDPAERARMWNACRARADIQVTSSVANNLEINTRTANKGAGLLALGERLGIAQSEILALGDSSNDIAMLQAVGVGVAMGNAIDEVKAAADCVTLTNEQDGVAAVIEQLLAG